VREGDESSCVARRGSDVERSTTARLQFGNPQHRSRVGAAGRYA
jgi:hypothetical protein